MRLQCPQRKCLFGLPSIGASTIRPQFVLLVASRSMMWYLAPVDVVQKMVIVTSFPYHQILPPYVFQHASF